MDSCMGGVSYDGRMSVRDILCKCPVCNVVLNVYMICKEELIGFILLGLEIVKTSCFVDLLLSLWFNILCCRNYCITDSF